MHSARPTSGESATRFERRRRRASSGPALVTLWALAVAGCGGGQKNAIWITHYPDFYTPDLKRVAVLPFASRVPDGGAGGRISDKVSSLLTSNGTYEVYTRAHLRDILAERDLADAGIISGEDAMEIGRVKAVQALVCGVLNRYEAQTRNETRYNQVPIWGYNQYGQQVITGWRQVPYVWTQHDGFVECHVVVIDTADGRQIAALSQPSNYWANGSPPRLTPDDCLRAAEDNQVNFIVYNLAVTRNQIKLKGKALQIATDFYDQKWDFTDRIKPEHEKLLLVVTLPPEADRNRFNLTIVPKGGREVVAEQTFDWTKQYGSYGYPFDLAAIRQSRGPGNYEAKLYCGGTPIATRDFQIVE